MCRCKREAYGKEQAERVKREFDEILPWDMFDYGIRKDFLIEENKKAHESVTTPNCRQKCAACGAARLNGGKCDAKR